MNNVKFRESGMPNEEMWDTFFDPESVLLNLGVDKDCDLLVDVGCGYGTFLLPTAGYTKDENGELVIVPEEAEVIRRIFKEFLEGKSPYKIAANLQRDGILNGSGGSRWYDSTVNKILKNEKYQGDALPLYMAASSLWSEEKNTIKLPYTYK